MNRRRVVAVVAIVAVCAAGVSVAAKLRRSPRGAANYAFITQQELIVMRGSSIVTRVPRRFDPADPYQNKVVWTHNGRHVAMLSDSELLQEPASATTLIGVDVEHGQTERIPCPGCDDLTPVGTDALLVRSYDEAAHRSAYNRFDLARRGASTPVAGLDGALLAGTNEFVMTNKGVFANEYEQQLVLSALDGYRSAFVGRFPSNDAMEAAATDRAARGGTRIAVGFRPNPGECVGTFPVDVFTAAPEAHVAVTGTRTDMSAVVARRGGTPADGYAVDDLWWGADGELRATIESWTCSAAGPNQFRQRDRLAALWRLDGTKWVEEQPTQATVLRKLGPTTQIALNIPDCFDPPHRADLSVYCNTGPLTLREGDSKRLIARGVIHVISPA